MKVNQKTHLEKQRRVKIGCCQHLNASKTPTRFSLHLNFEFSVIFFAVVVFAIFTCNNLPQNSRNVSEDGNGSRGWFNSNKRESNLCWSGL